MDALLVLILKYLKYMYWFFQYLHVLSTYAKIIVFILTQELPLKYSVLIKRR